MLQSTLALSFLLIAVSSNLAMAINKERKLPETLSRGWGDDITWVQTYEEGLFQAKQNNKPLMVIHHLDECQYSQATGTAPSSNNLFMMTVRGSKRSFFRTINKCQEAIIQRTTRGVNPTHHSLHLPLGDYRKLNYVSYRI
ncbi:anterior gradient protein 3-like isoform X2 [Microcaecilia unicolor]|uniref:Anterior gradient protein 3 isoform X2 n=1 Tax=Microcaecilia unicolor TaxID=1415580 RepID=A0A6P7Y2V0_9AMPH|nr:anterior gradient protein 3 isoform X2 [Microcaecilia unicolor]XP_030057325.1 anterior gradient protein 3-like isoform X2 [Microcaecilia unicolor]